MEKKELTEEQKEIHQLRCNVSKLQRRFNSAKMRITVYQKAHIRYKKQLGIFSDFVEKLKKEGRVTTDELKQYFLPLKPRKVKP